MGLLSWLLGNKKPHATEEVEAVEYKGFAIYADAIAESGQYRIAGYIKKFVDGEEQSHRFIRSDVLSSKRDADELMVKKAQMLIDQMGDDLF